MVFADLFAEDGVLSYPFPVPGQPSELRGREMIRAYHAAVSRRRELIEMAGEIVSYENYLNPLALAQIFGRTDDLISALSNA